MTTSEIRRVFSKREEESNPVGVRAQFETAFPQSLPRQVAGTAGGRAQGGSGTKRLPRPLRGPLRPSCEGVFSRDRAEKQDCGAVRAGRDDFSADPRAAGDAIPSPR